MGELSGQTALVTGAGSGIGQAIALGLARHGAQLALVGRRADALKQTAAQCDAQSQIYPIDLTDDRAVLQLAVELGAIDLVVHSAGAFARGPLLTAPVAVFDQLYRVNVRAPYLLTQALLPGLIARRGQVVFINSTAGHVARGEVGGYAASKFALRAVADALRDEVNAAGVRVLSVFPGRTATQMQRQVVALEGGSYHPERLMQPDDVAQAVVGALLLPRSAEITDLHVRPHQR